MTVTARRSATAETAAHSIAHAGKYLTFGLGDEFYGIDLLHVQEIIGLMEVTHVPKTPPYVRGVINLRGKVIPVMELRRRFDMEFAVDTERSCIIVLQTMQQGAPVTTGVLVDSVADVVDIAENQIEEAPSFGAAVSAGFIRGIGKVGQRIVILLDVDTVLAIEDAQVL